MMTVLRQRRHAPKDPARPEGSGGGQRLVSTLSSLCFASLAMMKAIFRGVIFFYGNCSSRCVVEVVFCPCLVVVVIELHATRFGRAREDRNVLHSDWSI
jgi:hypothetical protein